MCSRTAFGGSKPVAWCGYDYPRHVGALRVLFWGDVIPECGWSLRCARRIPSAYPKHCGRLISKPLCASEYLANIPKFLAPAHCAPRCGAHHWANTRKSQRRPHLLTHIFFIYTRRIPWRITSKNFAQNIYIYRAHTRRIPVTLWPGCFGKEPYNII